MSVDLADSGQETIDHGALIPEVRSLVGENRSHAVRSPALSISAGNLGAEKIMFLLSLVMPLKADTYSSS
jgi:hypothetical protein